MTDDAVYRHQRLDADDVHHASREAQIPDAFNRAFRKAPSADSHRSPHPRAAFVSIAGVPIVAAGGGIFPSPKIGDGGGLTVFSGPFSDFAAAQTAASRGFCGGSLGSESTADAPRKLANFSGVITDGRYQELPFGHTAKLYLSRSHASRATAFLPGKFTLGAGADLMNSLPSSILQKRRCSVPFHASFQDISTMVTNSLPSTRYLPL